MLKHLSLCITFTVYFYILQHVEFSLGLQKRCSQDVRNKNQRHRYWPMLKKKPQIMSLSHLPCVASFILSEVHVTSRISLLGLRRGTRTRNETSRIFPEKKSDHFFLYILFSADYFPLYRKKKARRLVDPTPHFHFPIVTTYRNGVYTNCDAHRRSIASKHGHALHGLVPTRRGFV